MKTTISVVRQQNSNLNCFFRLFHVNKFTDRVTSTVWVGFRGRLRTISKINGIAVFWIEYVCSELISRRRPALLMLQGHSFWVQIAWVKVFPRQPRTFGGFQFIEIAAWIVLPFQLREMWKLPKYVNCYFSVIPR